jgi:hypothetical protein
MLFKFLLLLIIRKLDFNFRFKAVGSVGEINSGNRKFFIQI